MPLTTALRRALSALSALVAVAACGPVSGPWGTIGGEWAYVCGAPRTAGQACGTSDACAAGLYCAKPNGSTNGTCAARVALGSTCAASEDCAAGLVCKAGALHGVCHLKTCDANGVCTQGAPSGATCDPPNPDCPAGQICALETTDPATCVPEPKVGDDCSGYLGIYGCGPTLACQRLTVKCVTLPGEGELCGFTPKHCAAGLVCRTNADPNKDGRCGKPVPVGQPCGSGGECEKGAHCDLGKLVCAKNLGVGASCANGNECGEPPFDVHNGVDCVRGSCVDTSKAGAECWPGEDNHCTPPRTCVPK